MFDKLRSYFATKVEDTTTPAAQEKDVTVGPEQPKAAFDKDPSPGVVKRTKESDEPSMSEEDAKRCDAALELLLTLPYVEKIEMFPHARKIFLTMGFLEYGQSTEHILAFKNSTDLTVYAQGLVYGNRLYGNAFGSKHIFFNPNNAEHVRQPIEERHNPFNHHSPPEMQTPFWARQSPQFPNGQHKSPFEIESLQRFQAMTQNEQHQRLLNQNKMLEDEKRVLQRQLAEANAIINRPIPSDLDSPLYKERCYHLYYGQKLKAQVVAARRDLFDINNSIANNTSALLKVKSLDLTHIQRLADEFTRQIDSINAVLEGLSAINPSDLLSEKYIADRLAGKSPESITD